MLMILRNTKIATKSEIKIARTSIVTWPLEPQWPWLRLAPGEYSYEESPDSSIDGESEGAGYVCISKLTLGD